MDSISMGLDLAVLGATGAMTLYCAQLGRRLRSLKRAEGGTAKALAALSAAIAANQRSAAEIALAAERAGERMAEASDFLASQCRKAEDLSGMLDGQTAQASRKFEKARRETETSLARATHRAWIELDALTRAAEVVAGRAAAAPSEPKRAVTKPPVRLDPVEGPIRQRAAAERNPYLRAVG